MSISHQRQPQGIASAYGRGWATRPALMLALAAIALTLSASGCGEKSLPAATRSVTPGGTEVASLEGSAKAAAGAPAAKTRARRQFTRDITFDTVKLNMRKGDPFHSDLLTPQVKRLDGNRIRVRGFILPPPQQSGLTRFVLVRDNMACCFGPGAALYDCMIVQMKKGLSTDYTVLPITVEGTFNIHEVKAPDGHTLSIYHLTADKAQ